MKLHDVKISTQLRLGLGLILALVVGLGVFAWRQTHLLWAHTQMMYNHPFQVDSVIGELEADILAVHGQMQALMVDPNEESSAAALEEIKTRSARAAWRFDVLFERYLGPRSDLTSLQDEFTKWNLSRDETLRLLRAGKTAEARERTLHGVDNTQVGVLIRLIHRVETFSRNEGDQFYQAATEQSDVLQHHLALVVGVIILLSLGIGWLLLNEIKKPLAELTATTKLFRQGRLDVRSQHASTNEFGTLAAAFNTMAGAIESQTQINENVAGLTDVMLREEEVHAFCREVLKGLFLFTGSQVGAVYLLNESKTAFEHFESIGLNREGRSAFSATALEGELGVVLATRQIQRITDIPATTRFTFAAVTGDFVPREILTIPVLSNQVVVAVISLANIHSYNDAAIQLVNKIWSLLTARINGVLAFHKIHEFAEQLAHQNHELEAQQRELAMQRDELTEQNTELEMQKIQLDEANRLKSAFLSNMSHELRTPLNSVIALSGVLSRRLAKSLPPEEHGFLEVIERNGKNLLTLINNILDLSRIEAGREEFSITRFALRDCVGEIVAMLEPLAREKHLTLINLVGDDLPSLHSDPDKCHHILQNLIANALKFTESGAVEIAARQVNDDLEVTVRDTGIGIAADQIPHIFDEFRQADDSTSRKYGGTGLGLAIAQKYAHRLGGDITVQSTPDMGSTFTLRLPLVTALPDTAPAERFGQALTPRPAAPPPVASSQRLLLVEDNDPAIIQLTDILHAQGYQVEVARDGRQALERIAQSVPDAMILDLMMPEVDGFQVLKALRSDERTAQVPVLILTAKHVTKQELAFLKGNHIHQLIQKGDINRDGLLAAVARMIAPAPATPPPPRRRPAGPGKALVLVVEDNADNLQTAHALLSEHYQVIAAENGHTALQQARLHLPDLILTDLALPVMDGFAALAAIRQDPALCDIPVVAVTASAMKGNREDILARGFDGYISKPIDHPTLLQTLHEFLG